jgi:hypothetical protein
MELEVRVGSALARFLEVIPGRDGEGRAVTETLGRLSPNVVCVDAALTDLARSAEGWYPEFVRKALDERGFSDPSRPIHAAREFAAKQGIEVIPLLGSRERGGWFAERRMLRALRRTKGLARDPRTIAAEARKVVAEYGGRRLARDLQSNEERMANALKRLLVTEQRNRLVAVLSYPRSERTIGLLLGRPLVREVAKVGYDSNR